MALAWGTAGPVLVLISCTEAVPSGLCQPCRPALPWRCLCTGHREVMQRGRRAGAWASPCAQLAAMHGVTLVCTGVLPCLRVRRAGTLSHLNIQPPAACLLVARELPKTPVTQEGRWPVRIFLSCLVSGAVLLQHRRGTAFPQHLFFFLFLTQL